MLFLADAIVEGHMFLSWHWEEWLGFLAAVGAVLLWRSQVEPALHARSFGATHVGHPQRVSRRQSVLVAIIVPALFVFLAEAFIITLHKRIEEHSPEFLALLAATTPTCGLVTFAWVRGSRRWPPRAARYGGLAGLLGSASVLPILFFELGVGEDVPEIDPVTLVGLLVVACLLWIFPWGLGGRVAGAALDRRAGHFHSGERSPVFAACGRMAAMLTLSGALAVLLFDVCFGTEGYADTLPSIMLLFLLWMAGWGLGLYLCPGVDRFLVAPPEEVRKRLKD
jgi:hypothetical protein